MAWTSIRETMSAFLLAMASEWGDKSQFMAIALSARYQRPSVVLGGAFLAYLLNHFLAAEFGAQIGALFSARTVSIIFGLICAVSAVLCLLSTPSKNHEEPRIGKSVFVGIMILFFLAETGDKSQLSTVTLAAKYGSATPVVIGGTLGTVLTDALGVWLGMRITQRLGQKLKFASAFVFGLFAVYAFWGNLGHATIH
jgi:putative Ca2+/H+ antiporter (TMEM165/GDT1 family)